MVVCHLSIFYMAAAWQWVALGKPDSIDCWTGPVEYNKCFGPWFGRGGNPMCFSGNLTFDDCCNFYWWGAAGNPDCWDGLRTYGRCCGAMSESSMHKRLMKQVDRKYKVWETAPTYYNLQMLWQTLGKHDLFVTRQIQVPGIIPTFYYMFPLQDTDQLHLQLDIDQP